MTEPLLLTAAQFAAFDGQRLLTRASAFFFASGRHLYLVTSRHVLIDEPRGHFPNRIEVKPHLGPTNLARWIDYWLMLYCEGRANWRQDRDAAGDIDVAAGMLLGVHSARLDVGTRDLKLDEALGLTAPGTPTSC